MKKERSDKLLELYENGMTTIEQEKELAEFFKNSDDYPWFDYLKSNKKKAPDSLETEIWNEIKKKKSFNKRLSFRYASVAATILLLLALFVFSPISNRQMSPKEKESVLAEAYAMIGDSEFESESKEIIYEDEILVLYTE